jgi:hydrogenase maturation factor
VIVQLSKNMFLGRLAEARRGQWLMYHVGFLMDDRDKDQAVEKLAKTVHSIYEQGKVSLVQRRLGPRMYEYYAIKR